MGHTIDDYVSLNSPWTYLDLRGAHHLFGDKLCRGQDRLDFLDRAIAAA